jgi:hypothetical protein
LNAEAQQTMHHLRDVLYFLADLHPDDSCEAVEKALEFYNRKHPNQHIEPRRQSQPDHAYARLPERRSGTQVPVDRRDRQAHGRR